MKRQLTLFHFDCFYFHFIFLYSHFKKFFFVFFLKIEVTFNLRQYGSLFYRKKNATQSISKYFEHFPEPTTQIIKENKIIDRQPLIRLFFFFFLLYNLMIQFSIIRKVDNMKGLKNDVRFCFEINRKTVVHHWIWYSLPTQRSPFKILYTSGEFSFALIISIIIHNYFFFLFYFPFEEWHLFGFVFIVYQYQVNHPGRFTLDKCFSILIYKRTSWNTTKKWLFFRRAHSFFLNISEIKQIPMPDIWKNSRLKKPFPIK